MKRWWVISAISIIIILLVSHFAFSATDTVPSPVPITKIKKTTYIYAGTLVASKSSDEPVKTHYYIQDHLGSNIKVLENGIPEQTNKYYAFGETTTTPPESDYPYRFTGKEYDPETGLYYYGARYYKPELGRFIQADVLRGNLEDPLSLNRYAYVKNNPLKFVDPSGNDLGNPADATKVVIPIVNVPKVQEEKSNPLDDEFFTQPVDTPLNWLLRKCGEACQHLGEVQDLPVFGAVGDAFVGIGQPTSLKEDIENGAIAGMTGGLKFKSGSTTVRLTEEFLSGGQQAVKDKITQKMEKLGMSRRVVDAWKQNDVYFTFSGGNKYNKKTKEIIFDLSDTRFSPEEAAGHETMHSLGFGEYAAHRYSERIRAAVTGEKSRLSSLGNLQELKEQLRKKYPKDF